MVCSAESRTTDPDEATSPGVQPGVERLHATGRALRQQLAEATTAADIEAVNWPEETTDADA